MTVDKETKCFKINPYFYANSHRTLVEDRNMILSYNIGKWLFKYQIKKGRKFLDVNDNDNLPTKPTYSKGDMWLNFIGHLNTLYIRVIRTITNYTFIGEYWLRFFLKKPFTYSYREYPINSKDHILHNCRRFNKY